MTTTSPCLYVIATAAPPVLRLTELLDELAASGWDSWVITTPAAATWIDTEALAAHTGHPVRVQPRLPHEQDPLPKADAVLAAPLTFNTLNKWASGISDTLALGLLNEALGLRLPITAAPVVKAALQRHPAYGVSLRTLRRCGVQVLDPDAVTVRTADDVTSQDWPTIVEALNRQFSNALE
ncbi:flavoprotein [Saccharopolyspora subtropica]|uniref:Flavoprotein n=1 Tax=Saccharopolyspora thermophila TaxID=89367 RepID=A0A917NL18_9PSEU|nr:flavoprotein [Saccharopolyspora subtropica]GGJ05609.1 flavoprotein [Saccharopolyspora subtropica]